MLLRILAPTLVILSTLALTGCGSNLASPPRGEWFGFPGPPWTTCKRLASDFLFYPIVRILPKALYTPLQRAEMGHVNKHLLKKRPIMALINCAECRREISDKAPACIGCGAPMETNTSVDASTTPVCIDTSSEVSLSQQLFDKWKAFTRSLPKDLEVTRKTWTFQGADREPTVTLEHGQVSGKRIVTVDGTVVHQSKKVIDLSDTEYRFLVGDQPCILKISIGGFKGLFYNYDLLVDGKMV